MKIFITIYHAFCNKTLIMKKSVLFLFAMLAILSAFSQAVVNSVTVIGVGADSRNPLTYVYEGGNNWVTLRVNATTSTPGNLKALSVYEAGGTLLTTATLAGQSMPASPFDQPLVEIAAGSNTYDLTVPINFLGTQIRLFVNGTNKAGSTGLALPVTVWQNMVRVYAQDFGNLPGTANTICPVVRPPIGPEYVCVNSTQPGDRQFALAKTLIGKTTYAAWSNVFSDRTTGVMIAGTPAQGTGLVAIINSSDSLSLEKTHPERLFGVQIPSGNTNAYPNIPGVNMLFPTVLYQETVGLSNGLCTDTYMYVSFWGMSMCVATGNTAAANNPISLAPRLAILVFDESNTLIASYPSNPGPNTSLPHFGQPNSTGAGNYITVKNGNNYFQQFSTRFNIPAGTSNVVFQIVNYNADSNGNDLALDDVEVWTIPLEVKLPTDPGSGYNAALSTTRRTYVYTYDAATATHDEQMQAVNIAATPVGIPPPSDGSEIMYRWIYNTSVNFNLLDPSTWETAPLRVMSGQTTATLSGYAHPYDVNTITGLIDTTTYRWIGGLDLTPNAIKPDSLFLPGGFYRLVAGSPANFNNSEIPKDWNFGCLAVSDALQIMINENYSVRVYYNAGVGQAGENAAIQNAPYEVPGQIPDGMTEPICLGETHKILSGAGLIPPDGMYFYAWLGDDGDLFTTNQETHFEVCEAIGYTLTAQYAPLPQMNFHSCADAIVVDIPVRGYQSLVKTDMSMLIRDAENAGDSVVYVWGKLDLTQWSGTTVYDINGQPRKRIFRPGVNAPDTVIWLYGRPPSNLNSFPISSNDAGAVFATQTTNWATYDPTVGDTYTLYVPSISPANDYSIAVQSVFGGDSIVVVQARAGFSKRIAFMRQLKIVDGVAVMSDGQTDITNDGMSRQIIFRNGGNVQEFVGFRLVSNFFNSTTNYYLSTDILGADADAFIPISVTFVPLKMIWKPYEISPGVFSQDWNNYRNWTIAQPMPDISCEQDTQGYFIGYNPSNLTKRGGAPIFADFVPDSEFDNETIKAVPWNCTSVVIPANSPVFPDLTPGVTNFGVQAPDIVQSADTRPLCYNVVFDYGKDLNNNLISAQITRPDLLVYRAAYLKLAKQANRWHMVSAPLQRMYTGDFYSQHRNPFLDLMPDAAWNGTTNNIQRPLWVLARLHRTANPQTGSATATNALGFTGTFNNPAVEIPVGQGFAVWFNSGVSFNDGMADQSLLNTQMYFPKTDLIHNIWTDVDRPVQEFNVQRGGAEHRFAFESVVDAGGNITIDVSASGAGEMLLIGNPFMANWNIDSVMALNPGLLAPRYYYLPVDATGRNDGVSAFVPVTRTSPGVWTDAGTEGRNEWIAPWEAIVVYSAAKFGSLITNTTDTQVIFPEEEDENPEDEEPCEVEPCPEPSPALSRSQRATEAISQLRIRAEKDGKTHATMLVHRPTASNNYNMMEDAKALFVSNVTAPIGIYTRSACNVALNIHSFGDTEQIIWLGVRTSTTGKIRLRFEGLGEFLTEHHVYINNVKTKEKISLRNNPTYEFEKTETVLFVDDQLYLSFEPINNDITTKVDTPKNDDNIRVMTESGELKIVSNNYLQTVEVYDILGRLVNKAENINSPVYSIGSLPTNQFYIVRATTRKTSVATKVRMH